MIIKIDKTRQLLITFENCRDPVVPVDLLSSAGDVAMLSEAGMNINLFTLLPCRYVTKQTDSLKCDTTVFLNLAELNSLKSSFQRPPTTV